MRSKVPKPLSRIPTSTLFYVARNGKDDDDDDDETGNDDGRRRADAERRCENAL